MFVPKKRLRLGIRCMASTASVIVVGSIAIEGGPKGKKEGTDAVSSSELRN